MENLLSWFPLDLALIAENFDRFLYGVGVTLSLTFLSLAVGGAMAVPLAVARASRHRVLNPLIWVYTYVFRGTPLLVQLFLFYYGMGQFEFVRNNPVLWWLVGDGMHCAIMALALNTAAYTSEILRGGLMSVPTGLVEAAKAAGMSRVMRFRRIEFPLAIRQALPAYSNELILVVKGTSLASTITVLEITGYAKRLMSQTYAILEVFAVAGLVYLAINMTLIAATHWMERRLAGPSTR